jgi:hypothetical protein
MPAARVLDPDPAQLGVVAFLRPAAAFLVAVSHERAAPGAVALTLASAGRAARMSKTLRLPAAQDRHGGLLGRIVLPELPANLAWGADGSVLFLTARTSVYRLQYQHAWRSPMPPGPGGELATDRLGSAAAPR